MLTLDLAIATHRPEGIGRVEAMNLPKVEGVRYIVSWQSHENAAIPTSLKRDDIEIFRFDKIGQSLNRNNALDHCSAEIVLNSDDDLIYTAEQLTTVQRAFEGNQDADLITFKVAMSSGPVYPQNSCRLSEPLPKGYWAPTVATAFRRAGVNGLRFHPLLGLGSPKLHGAEDEFFLLSAIRRGLNCTFIPITICTHPGESTGTKSTITSGNLRAAGCYIAIAYQYTWPLRLILKAKRLAASGRSGFWRSLRGLSVGVCYAPRVLHSKKCYRW